MSEEKTPYVFHLDSPGAQRVESLKEAQKLMKTPEFKEKGARLILSRSQREADEYFSKFKSKTEQLEQQLEAAADGYKNPFPRLSTFDLNTMAAAMRAKDLPKVQALMDKNPNYIIDMSVDKPTILHHGTHRNAFHLAAQTGFYEFIQYLMRLISNVDYLMKIYNFEDKNSMAQTSKMLREGFLNNPDKMGNIPAKLAAKFKFYQTAAYLTCFHDFIYRPLESLQLQRDQFESDRDYKRILDLFRSPQDVFCVSLYFHEDRHHFPFVAITRKFPPHAIQDVYLNFGHFHDDVHPKEVLVSNEILKRPVKTPEFHEPFHHLQAVVGVFSDINECIEVCQVLSKQIKTLAHNENFLSLTAPEREELFISVAKKIANDTQCFAFIVESKELPINLAIEELRLKLEGFSTTVPVGEISGGS
uniref:Ankyrin repeat protein n=1 Tax=Panagrolaimus sp. JU765 TaxID=591449 RepID=A0AC34Q5R4_9BILA